MGRRLAIGLEGPMGALSRVIDRVLGGSGPLHGKGVERDIERAAATEAPIRSGRVARQVADSLVGMGPLDDLLADPAVTDILVNAHNESGSRGMEGSNEALSSSRIQTP